MGQKSVKQDFYKKGYREGQLQPVYVISNITHGIIAISHDKEWLVDAVYSLRGTHGYKVYLERVNVNNFENENRTLLQEFTWDFDQSRYL